MIPKFYRTLQYLSIDIVLGAVILLHFFSKPFGISVEWPSYVSLASAVWLIYTIDHLKDARASADPKRGRYLFHLRYARTLKLSIVLVTSVAGVCLFFLPTSILFLGSILGALCLLYLLFQSSLARLGLKECYASIMYSFGILITPIALSGTFDIFDFFILFALSFTNLLIFSWFEVEEDKEDSIRSVATVKGTKRTEKLIWILISLGLAMGFSGILSQPHHCVYLIVVLLIYWILLVSPEWARKNQRYRTIGDGVFMLPLVLALL